MKLSTTLTMLLVSGALASAACVVEQVDTDNTGGGGSDPTTSGTGGDATGGGGTGGDAMGGMGGMSEGGGGEGGGGDACLDACDAMHPDGIDDYFTYLSCAYCSACYDICDGGTMTVCEAGEQVGTCSADANDCDECVESACTADVDMNGTTSGVCAAELDGFLNNAEAIALNDCYGACP